MGEEECVVERETEGVRKWEEENKAEEEQSKQLIRKDINKWEREDMKEIRNGIRITGVEKQQQKNKEIRGGRD